MAALAHGTGAPGQRSPSGDHPVRGVETNITNRDERRSC